MGRSRKRMLRLVDIKKEYGDGETKVNALKGVSIDFESKGIVSICGQSGCGKTTLLNIIGGLDRYTTGDLIIDGVSTKQFSNSDWDAYRNHNVGFVFQNYYLIPQLTVLENVMLAMNISGVSREEQKKKAIEALEKVGLSNQLKKKPKQLSGGQAQRVAIARAVCNHPSIILADEPTGALDSENSVQILELLKTLSEESLVIIVTHNGELAQAYSDRIIHMKDGEVVSDETIRKEKEEKSDEAPVVRKKRTNISIGASFLISLKNLYYKKGRTLITAFAGCIGVIAISVILAFNAGFTSYALSFQKSQLSRYPISVRRTQSSLSDIGDVVSKMDGDNYATLDTGTILDILTEETATRDSYTEEDLVYIQKLITGIVANFDGITKENDTTKLTEYIADHKAELDEICVIKNDYNVTLNVYRPNDKAPGEYMTLSPFSTRIIEGLTSSEINLISNLIFHSTLPDKEKNDIVNAFGGVSFWDSLIEDDKILSEQYELLDGRWPSSEKEQEGVYEIVLVVDKYNQITDAALYALGKIDMIDLVGGILHNSGETIEKMLGEVSNTRINKNTLKKLLEAFTDVPAEYAFSDFIYDEETEMGEEYKLLVGTDYYKAGDDGRYAYIGEDKAELNNAIETEGVTLRISGVVRQKEDVTSGCINGVLGYPQSLAKYIIEKIANSDLVKQQKAEYDKYVALTETDKYQAYEALTASVSSGARDLGSQPLTEEETALLFECGSYSIKNMIKDDKVTIDVIEYESMMDKLGVKQLDVPEAIYFYPFSVDASEKVVKFLDGYNEEMKLAYANGETTKDESVDYVNELKDIMNGLNGMINTITFILIAITCLSVFVSAIMVAIIMYISVQDRTKEIGILRSMGARKFDIMNIFNAETILLGLFSGLLGILIGYVLTYPLNTVLKQKLFIANLLTPLWWHAIILLAASVALTCISGIVPAIIAAHRDPVKSLRAE